jgi:hypothetical protein
LNFLKEKIKHDPPATPDEFPPKSFLFERPRRRWEDNIKVDIREIGWGGHRLNPSGSGYGQVPGCCEYGDESSGFIKCGEFLG